MKYVLLLLCLALGACTCKPRVEDRWLPGEPVVINIPPQLLEPCQELKKQEPTTDITAPLKFKAEESRLYGECRRRQMELADLVRKHVVKGGSK